MVICLSITVNQLCQGDNLCKGMLKRNASSLIVIHTVYCTNTMNKNWPCMVKTEFMVKIIKLSVIK